MILEEEAKDDQHNGGHNTIKTLDMKLREVEGQAKDVIRATICKILVRKCFFYFLFCPVFIIGRSVAMMAAASTQSACNGRSVAVMAAASTHVLCFV